jgi:hypothetical protein
VRQDDGREVAVVEAEFEVRVKTWSGTTSGGKRLQLQIHAHIRVSEGLIGRREGCFKPGIEKE